MNQALLLIDIQNDYFPGGKMELHNSSQAGANAKIILNNFRIKGLPIIHIRHISTREGATFFLPDTLGSEIYSLLSPLPDEKLIIKHYPNSFRETELLDYLKANGITKLTICGMMTHMCVDSTIRAAFDFGIECELIEDACASKDLKLFGKTITAEHVHNSTLAALNGLFAKVINLEDFIKMLDDI